MKRKPFTKLLLYLLIFINSVYALNNNKSNTLYNQTAYITSQCYTKTIDENNKLHNPCYACHTKGEKPNFVNDSSLQKSYSFPLLATQNPWTNLFKDRSKEVQNISDEEMLQYIKEDNYSALAKKLKNNTKKWDGYIPDCYFNFDNDGFDRDTNNTLTGWRAFQYRPFLGTFWPTNGSTDDVIIRLPKVFQKNIDGKIDIKIYKQNLNIVKDLITKSKKHTNYVGLASSQNLQIALGLYPLGTEFLHTVRYIQPTKDGIKLSKRMKELRYAKKTSWVNYSQHKTLVTKEIKEQYDFPDRLSTYFGNEEQGISNNKGWIYQGFIEDKKGELRAQTYEETLYCIGCHSNIGAITDSTFAFKRIYNWGYWGKNGLKGIIDKDDEYKNYLIHNNHANEFRTNQEVYTKFFNNGTINSSEMDKLKNDISHLLVPSYKRAMNLNKAYKVIVNEQSYIYGREAHIKPLVNVHKSVEQDQSTNLKIIK